MAGRRPSLDCLASPEHRIPAFFPGKGCAQVPRAQMLAVNLSESLLRGSQSWAVNLWTGPLRAVQRPPRGDRVRWTRCDSFLAARRLVSLSPS